MPAWRSSWCPTSLGSGWYWTAEQFRGRMVDAVDRVDLLAADPEYRFLLDGQAVVVEDYLAVRPGAGTS